MSHIRNVVIYRKDVISYKVGKLEAPFRLDISHLFDRPRRKLRHRAGSWVP